MKWFIKGRVLCFAALLQFGLHSCQEKDLYEEKPTPEVPSKGDYFDFSTSNDIQLNINYGFKDYHVVFELYAENPLSEDGNNTKTDAEPLFRAYTDNSGNYANGITLPAYLESVYLYSEYIGTISPVKLSVSNGKVEYNQKDYIAGLTRSTRGSTGSGKAYPDGYRVLGDWNANGRPDYLAESRYDVSAKFINSIRAYYNGTEWTFADVHPELFAPGVVKDIHVVKPTGVNLIFLHSGAAYDNTVGYYTYPTNNPPASRADIKNPVIAFPRVTATFRADAGAFYGDQVQLKYWNETTGAFEDKFPAGTSIGWFMISQGASNSNRNIVEDNGTATFYSTSADFARYSSGNSFLVNDANKQRTAALLYDETTKHMISLTFEDRMSDHLSPNYYDAGFFIHVVEEDAILPPPVLPPGGGVDDPVYTSYSGTLVFEDMWPEQGDYDMNDLVINYTSKQYTSYGSYNVIKIEDTFVPRHNGATYTNGFGYQLFGRFQEGGVDVDRYVNSSSIKSIKIESKSGTVSKFMNGNSLEPGQTNPTIILFDDLKDVLSKGETFKVTIEFNGAGINDREARPPYNPFIIVETDLGRGKEVHLVNYPPTKLANTALFGTADDKSYPEVGLYYVSDNKFPFALHLSSNINYKWPAEKVRIDETYKKFSSWVSSNGVNDRDWYNYPSN